MYKVFYNMSYNPFSKTIKIKDTFQTPDIIQVHSRLDHLKNYGGIGLITADPGYGKTYAIRSWTNNQNSNTTKIVYLCLTTVTNREFLQQLCYLMGVEPVFKKSELYTNLQNAVKTYVLNRKMKVIVFIDEAHYLSPSILKDLQMITNFEMDSQDLMSLVLVGHSVLGQILTRQPYESLKQRLIVNYKLNGISKDYCIEYVHELLKKAGADCKIFDEAAIKVACDISGGSIRNFDSLITNSLVIGAQNKSRNINTEMVQSAADSIMLY